MATRGHLAHQLIFSAYQFELYSALAGAPDATWPRAGARRSRVDYHRDHAAQWTPLARRRHQALARPDAGRAGGDLAYVEELFDPAEIADDLLKPLPGIAVDPGTCAAAGPTTCGPSWRKRH